MNENSTFNINNMAGVFTNRWYDCLRSDQLCTQPFIFIIRIQTPDTHSVTHVI